VNKSPLKIGENRERWRIHGLPKFLKYPILSQERVKVRTSTLAGIVTGSIRTNPLKIWEKRECGRIHGLPNFFEYSLLSQDRAKLPTSNLADVFTGSMQTKAHIIIRRKGSVGVSRDFPNF